nr:type I restriction-modification system subunit M N-terminal domain-containing protein [Endozoicomonas sp. 4G]
MWSVADLLWGGFKQSQYGRIILPFTLLRLLECVLAPSKASVQAKYGQVKSMNLPTDGKEKMLLPANRTTENPQGLTFLILRRWIFPNWG